MKTGCSTWSRVLQSSRNAFTYSSQIRMTHSIVMILLFNPSAHLRQHLSNILS